MRVKQHRCYSSRRRKMSLEVNRIRRFLRTSAMALVASDFAMISPAKAKVNKTMSTFLRATIRELIMLTLPPPRSLFCQLLRASRLLPPRSGLERSDFVLWPVPATSCFFGVDCKREAAGLAGAFHPEAMMSVCLPPLGRKRACRGERRKTQGLEGRLTWKCQ